METTISVPEEMLRRADAAARRLDISHSEFFVRAVERWVDALDDDDATAAIDRAIAGVPARHAFTDAAAATMR